MGSTIEDDLFCFDSSSHPALNFSADKQKKDIRALKKRIITTSALIEKCEQRAQQLSEIREKNEMMTAENIMFRKEAQDACKNYEKSQEKCLFLEKEVNKLQQKNNEYERIIQQSVNREAAAQSHIEQLKPLLKERDNKIEYYKEKLDLANKAIKTCEQRNTWLKKTKEAYKKNLCNVAEVVFYKRVLTKKEKLTLYKYIRMKNQFIEKEGDSTIPEGEELDSDDDTLVNEELPLSDIEDTEANLGKIEDSCTGKDVNGYDSDNISEIVSVDTGRGTSLEFSDSDKCFQSPEYSIDSPLGIELINKKNNDVEAVSNTITNFKQTREMATSPIIFLIDQKEQNNNKTSRITEIETDEVRPLSVSIQSTDTSYMKSSDGNIDGIEPFLPVQEKISESCTNLCDDNSNDKEIEMILHDMRITRNLLTPIPPTPVKSLRSRSRINLDLNNVIETQDHEGIQLNILSQIQDMVCRSHQNEKSESILNNNGQEKLNFIRRFHKIVLIVNNAYKEISRIMRDDDDDGINIETSTLDESNKYNTCDLGDPRVSGTRNHKNKEIERIIDAPCSLYETRNSLGEQDGVNIETSTLDESNEYNTCDLGDPRVSVARNPKNNEIERIIDAPCSLYENGNSLGEQEEEGTDCIILPISQSKPSDKLQFVDELVVSNVPNTDDVDNNIDSLDNTYRSPTKVAKNTSKKKKLTKLEKLRKNYEPKYKIKNFDASPLRKLRSRKIIPINKEKDKLALNNKEAYEKAVKVMTELKLKQKNLSEKCIKKKNLDSLQPRNIPNSDYNSENKCKVIDNNNTTPSKNRNYSDNVNIHSNQNKITTSRIINNTPRKKSLGDENENKRETRGRRKSAISQENNLNVIETRNRKMSMDSSKVDFVDVNKGPAINMQKSVEYKRNLFENVVVNSCSDSNQNITLTKKSINDENENKRETRSRRKSATSAANCSNLVETRNRKTSTDSSKVSLLDVNKRLAIKRKKSVEYTGNLSENLQEKINDSSITSQRKSSTEYKFVKITNRSEYPSFADTDLKVVLDRSLEKNIKLIDKNSGKCKVLVDDKNKSVKQSLNNLSRDSSKFDQLSTNEFPKRRLLRRFSIKDKNNEVQNPIPKETSNIITYTDLDIFENEPPQKHKEPSQKKQRSEDENTKDVNKILNPEDSILTKMIDKYASDIRPQAPKVSQTVVATIKKKIEENIAHILELPPSESKKEMDKFIEEIQNWKFNEFLFGIMMYLKDSSRKMELYNKIVVPPAPAFTKSEQVLLYVLPRLEGTWPGVNVVESILSQIQYIIFRLNSTPEFDVIDSMSHFYAILCRYIMKKSRLRLFVLDAMYCINFKAVPLIKHCLEVWMHIMPLAHMGIAKSPLVTSTVYLLYYFKNKDDRFNRVQEIRNILANKYFYKINEWNENKILEMFKNSILELKECPIERKMLRLALIILAKRQGPRWCQNKIITNMILPLITSENSSKIAKVFCVSMLGPLLKPYPIDMKVHCEIIMNQLIDMLDTNTSPKMQEAIYTSLINMSKHNQNRVIKALLKWKPKEQSLEMERVFEHFVQEKCKKNWKTLLTKISLNSTE